MMSSVTGTPSQRSFVGKKNKMTAADVRKHVMTGSVLVHPTPIDLTTTDGSIPTLCLLDVLDPYDVEEVLAHRKSSALYDISSTTSSPRKVSEFPADDVEVRLVPRELLTIDSHTNSQSALGSVELHVQDILASFTDSFVLVQKKYQQFSSGDSFMRMMIERTIIMRSTQRQVYEADGARPDRLARSASVVGDLQDSVSKRASYASTTSTGTMGSVDGEVRESRLRLSQPDPTISGVINRTQFTQMDQANESKRHNGRHTSLVNLMPVQAEEDVIEKRSAPQYPEEKVGQKLIVKVVKLNVEPYFEPIFGMMAIYDAKNRRKVSENFNFDVNPDHIRAMVDRGRRTDYGYGICNQAAFSITQPFSDLFLVVKLERVLSACEISEASEPYTVSNAKDDRTREKLSQAANEYCERLGAHRMPLGFMIVDLQRVLTGVNSLERGAALEGMSSSTYTTVDSTTSTIMGEAPLAAADGDSILSADRVSIATTSTFRRIGSGTSASAVFNRMRTPIQKRKFLGGGGGGDDATDSSAAMPPEMALANMQPMTLTLNSIFRIEGDKLTDEDIYKLLADARKPNGKLSKLKSFPAELAIQLSGRTGEELLMRLSPEYLRIAPFSGDAIPPTKDILEVPLGGQYSVNTSYRNLLYVYPRSVNFSTRQGTARNICCKVQLMNGNEQPQRVVFPKNAGTALTTIANTSVIYHNKTPQMYDELKMQIPIDINDGHHLLFTFYHISCKASSKDDEVEFPIGYSWLPIYRKNHLESGDFALPICLDRPPLSYGYLDPTSALPNLRWLDGHRPLFHVSLNAVTTVHPQDEHLERFFHAASSLSSSDKKDPPVDEVELVAAIQGVCKARPEPMVAFLYNCMDKLLALMANPPYSMAVSVACFETMGQLVKICTMLLDSCLDSHGRSALLVSYIHYFKIAMKESKARSQLCREMSIDKNKPSSPETQKLMHIIEDMERSTSVKALAADAPATPTITSNKAIHEELAELWVRSGGVTREIAYLNSWFFFELIMKSMAEYLSMTGRLYLARKSRFGDRFIRSLSSLSTAVATEVVLRLSKDARQSVALTNSWAFFLKDAFSLMDRTYVMGLVRDFNREMTLKISCFGDPACTTLMIMKMDFNRIVCSHEHFVILNLPFASGLFVPGMQHSVSSPTITSPPSAIGAGSSSVGPSSAPSPGRGSTGSRSSVMSLGELTVEYRKFHYLIGLILGDLASILESSHNPILHSRAIGTIRNLLATHEADSRLTDVTVRSRVASLYFPLVTIVMDAVSQLYDPYASMNFDKNKLFDDPFLSSAVPVSVNQTVALAIAGIGPDASPPSTPVADVSQNKRYTTCSEGSAAMSTVTPTNKYKLNQALTKQLLVCFSWVLKHLDAGVLRQWIRELPPLRLGQFADVLHLCVSCFEYKSPAMQQAQADTDSLASDPEESLKQQQQQTFVRGSGANKKDGVKWRDSSATKASSTCLVQMRRGSTVSTDDESILDAAVCAEVNLCVLDALETIIGVVASPGCDHLLFVLPIVFREMMHMLSCHQSVQTLESVFASQRAFVAKYPELVFEQETEQCGELCLQLLRHCASRLPTVRSQAAASIYLLLRESFESGSSLARVKMQITMSLSTLVSNGTRLGAWLNEDCLRRSLKNVLIYAETDANSSSAPVNANFSEQAKDLVFNLHMILSDTVKMKEFANDFEMTMDLMYRVAKGYQNNPDLRLTWLLSMASRHADRKLYCEAGQCMLHAAALAAEYIAMTTIDGYMPRGAHDFSILSENISEECAVSDDVVSPEVDGICESRHFTCAGLVNLVEKSTVYLEKAQMYELLPDVFKIIEPVLREWRDYRRLSSIHARLSAALGKIEHHQPVVEDIADAWMSPLRSADKRCFGTYFRVGFYGSRFEDIDGEEFIYKEPPFTKLSEISHRLELFYSDRFGTGVVEVIKDSNNVQRSSHDCNKAYLQITYVEPYFDKWERRRRPTHFERNHGIKRFVYATPFTRDGKAHGDLKDQFKRRTILTTEKCFPYVKTRIRVVEREQKVLQPIQVAIDDIEKKTRELAAAVSHSPSDAKMLQMVLQGCIGTTVNQGPVQVANVFLTNIVLDERGKPVDRLQNKLRLCFRDFSKKCSDALALNKRLIQPDQIPYQNELEKNYQDFRKKIAQILGTGLLIKKEDSGADLDAVQAVA